MQQSNAELDIIQCSIECDPVYSTVYHLTLRGWPKSKAGSCPHCQNFWAAWGKLSINSGLLFKGTRVCIPPELLNHTLANLHGTQNGTDRMQAQAREAVYWPGIDAYIADYVHWCIICTKHKASLPAQPMLPRDIPDGLWQEIPADYLSHKGKEYLLMCDLFSKYPFIYKVSTKSAWSLCACLHELISQYGPPSLLYMNNGPPFASDDLTQFLQHHHIDHITSSPTSQGLMAL